MHALKPALLRNAIKSDLLRFSLPALVVLIVGLIVCAGDGYDGLTETLWRLATGRREVSDLSAANAAGLVMCVVGLTLAIAAAFTLKQSYSSSLVIREGHQLVTHGVYCYVRHPLYLGALIAILGAPVYAPSVAGALVLSALIPLVLLRIRMEEALLIEHFGEQYLAYRAKTKKLIPFLY